MSLRFIPHSQSFTKGQLHPPVTCFHGRLLFPVQSSQGALATGHFSCLFLLHSQPKLLRNLYAGQEVTEPDMEQQTGSKLGKEYVKAVYCHPAYLTYMQSISCEMQGWMKQKLKSRLLGEISITSDMHMIPPLWQRVKRN